MSAWIQSSVFFFGAGCTKRSYNLINTTHKYPTRFPKACPILRKDIDSFCLPRVRSVAESILIKKHWYTPEGNPSFYCDEDLAFDHSGSDIGQSELYLPENVCTLFLGCQDRLYSSLALKSYIIHPLMSYTHFCRTPT